jgi:hypothetical protein
MLGKHKTQHLPQSREGIPALRPHGRGSRNGALEHSQLYRYSSRGIHRRLLAALGLWSQARSMESTSLVASRASEQCLVTHFQSRRLTQSVCRVFLVVHAAVNRNPEIQPYYRTCGTSGKTLVTLRCSHCVVVLALDLYLQ